MARVPAAMVSMIIESDGFCLEKRKNWSVRIEYITKSSVKTLPINQAVCRVCSPLFLNVTKYRKSKRVLIAPKIVVERSKSLISYFLGVLRSSTETLSVEIEIIGKSESRFNRRICMGNMGRNGINSDEIPTA